MVTNVNLIPAPRRQAAAAHTYLVKWVAAMGLYCILLLATSVVCVTYADKGASPLTRESRRLSARLDNATRTLLSLHRERTVTQQKLLSAKEVGKQPDWGVLMAVLVSNLTDEVVLDLCRLERGRKKGGSDKQPTTLDGQLVLVLSGLAKSQADVSGFILRLEKTNLFAKVTMVKARREPFLSSKAIAFELKCSIETDNSSIQ